MSNTGNGQPHIALFPGAGMGHLIPYLRIAAMLSSRTCLVTLITPHPTVTAAESAQLSAFFATHPTVNRLELQLLPPSDPTADDPFFIHMDTIGRSVPLLRPLLSTVSPPLSAIFTDICAAAGFFQMVELPIYIVSTTSARFNSLIVYLPYFISESENSLLAKSTGDDRGIEIPGLSPFPLSCVPPPMFNLNNNKFSSILISNSPSLSKAKGIIINTFEWFDQETISAFNNGKVLSNFPPLLPIGPLEPCDLGQDHHPPPIWLDGQNAESVVYVSFGNRTALSRDQIREVGEGLERSGFPFFWVLKAQKVDKDDKEELQDLLGDGFLERTKDKGKIVKGWINQEEILAHPAIGGFVSHCGWNSVMEAARKGIPLLAWPQIGDQKINAELVEKAGLGSWQRHWGWAVEVLVLAEEIEKEVVKLMTDDELRAKAKRVGQEAKTATGSGGSSEIVLQRLIDQLKPKEDKNHM